MYATTTPAPQLAKTSPYTLDPAGLAQWRVRDRTHTIIGHLTASQTVDGTRFIARRYHHRSGTFLDLGTFWSAQDAVDCLRYSQ